MTIRSIVRVALVAALVASCAGAASAHPLGNFSVNRWAGLETAGGALRIHYVVDYAEIPTFRESPAIDTNDDGVESPSEIASFANDLAARLVHGVSVSADGHPLPLERGASTLTFAPGAGGLRTMRFETTYEAAVAGRAAIAFSDANFDGQAGWREVIAWSGPAGAVVDSTVPGRDRSDRLRSYPRDLTQAPPRISEARFIALSGADSEQARAAGRAVLPEDSLADAASSKTKIDRFAALIRPGAADGLGLMLAALAAALFWGGAHALSPGHGKTVVAAYLVGQKGAARHAVFLGLIVTATHTIGVFALGGLTLLLSQWFVPDAIYPWLGFVSGAIVTAMGVTLLVRRLTGAPEGHAHHHHGDHDHVHSHDHAHDHVHAHGHAHGHSHAIPERLTLKGLLLLGVSGGIVPCPSALVVLLSAVAFHRLGFGMLLITAFSIGLAAVLVGVGLTMVYARSVFDRFDPGRGLTRRLGQLSAAAITLLGIGLLLGSVPAPVKGLLGSLGTGIPGAALGVLGLGLLFGLKHATEADHIAAVSAIVSERRGWRAAMRTGALWGTGHTVSILVAGLLVLGLNVVIPSPVARVLEFGVALMIVVLGSAALGRALRSRPDAHVHAHAHGGRPHRHLHFHEPEHEHVLGGAGDTAHDHGVQRTGIKPLLVGMMHGLAGSAALTLLVLAQIRSFPLGIAYLLVFGIGSIGGMALMSLLIGLPFSATAAHPAWNRSIRVAAGLASLAFGIFYAVSQIG